MGFVKCLGGDDDEVRIAMPFKGTGSDAPSRDGSIYLDIFGRDPHRHEDPHSKGLTL